MDQSMIVAVQILKHTATNFNCTSDILHLLIK